MGEQQPGPIYDNALKRLTAHHLGDICQWLGLGSPVDVVAESEELPAHGQRVDLLVRIGDRRLAHIEFFRRGDRNAAARMVEYLARAGQRFPGFSIEQFILLLGAGEIEEEFRRDALTVHFHVIKLRECDPAELLLRPAAAPLAVLAKCSRGGRRQLLRDALEAIAKSGAPHTKTLMEIAETLARICLPLDVVTATGREARMPFDLSEFPPSPGIIQAHADGEARGVALGEARGGAKMVGIMLRSRFGDDPRIDRIAGRLAEGDPEVAFRTAMNAASLADLDS
ncbi:hypothetical protein [Fodinicola acaciae]|uniref:hypothetical protein n=1 Tax=Fodinicola acaciae TaxID=2681555 RepID=UPI0013D499B1|nr:hypothetical protein [Fodinicola acaciae]